MCQLHDIETSRVIILRTKHIQNFSFRRYCVQSDSEPNIRGLGCKSGHWKEQPKEKLAYPENPVRGEET